MFNPEREPLNLAAITLDSHAALSEAPVIGVYGKVGVTKGTFNLIETLGGLAAQGAKFTFAAMIGDAQRQSIAQALARAGIESRTMVLPMLPIWRVPAFLRACTAVCFLERDFPIAIHGPIIPREVLACGTCLILSQEIAAKQRYGDRLADKENVLIVPDPKDHAGLSAALRVILEDPERAAEIGAQGAELSRSLENYEAFVLGWESLFAGCATSRDQVQDDSLPSVAHADIVALMPDLYAFLKRVCPQRIVAFQAAGSPTEPFDAAIALCYFVAAGLEDSLDSTLLPRVRAALAYAKARLIAGHIPKADRTPIFPVSDRLLGRPATLDAIGRLRPVRGSGVRIEAFDFDVSKVRMLLTVGGLPPNDDDGADLAELEPKATLVLFNRAPNLSPCELRIDAATRRLVETCDGHLTTNELIAEMCGYFCAVSQAQRDEVGTELCQALDRLYQSGVIVFGDYRPGWGWLGGARGRETIPLRPTPRSAN